MRNVLRRRIEGRISKASALNVSGACRVFAGAPGTVRECDLSVAGLSLIDEMGLPSYSLLRGLRKQL